jgi:ABC-type bacteriocin/lantibiotic exporter with double-glycine peptidase domain
LLAVSPDLIERRTTYAFSLQTRAYYILSLFGGEVLVFPQQRSRWWRAFPGELRWLAKQVRPFVQWLATSFLCITAGSLLVLLTPLVLKWLIDSVIPQKNTGLLLFSVLQILLGYQGRTALTSLGNFLMLSAAHKMSLTLRIDLLRHLDTLSAEYYENTSVGSLMYP